MSVLVLRVAAPMASWGDQSQYRQRTTRTDPTYSALRGMLAAAAGVGRGERPPAWLDNIELAFRVDDPGSLLEDFHTINPPDRGRYFWMADREAQSMSTVAKASGAKHDSPVITTRFYRQDATYLVFVADPTGEARQAALSPRWQLSAGRKSCVLTFPFVLDSVETGSLEEAVSSVPRWSDVDGELDACFFTPPSGLNVLRGETVQDRLGARPASFIPGKRFYVRVDPPARAEAEVTT